MNLYDEYNFISIIIICFVLYVPSLLHSIGPHSVRQIRHRLRIRIVYMTQSLSCAVVYALSVWQMNGLNSECHSKWQLPSMAIKTSTAFNFDKAIILIYLEQLREV